MHFDFNLHTTIQIKTQATGVTIGEREDRPGGGANTRKPELLSPRDTPVVYSESPSLQRLTNDSPGYNNWLSSKTLTPTESKAKTNLHAAREISKLWIFFSLHLLLTTCRRNTSEQSSCPNLPTIFSISVPAGQSRHARRTLREIWQACPRCTKTHQSADSFSSNQQFQYSKTSNMSLVALYIISEKSTTQDSGYKSEVASLLRVLGRSLRLIQRQFTLNNCKLRRLLWWKPVRVPVWDWIMRKKKKKKGVCHLTTPYTSRPTQQVHVLSFAAPPPYSTWHSI